MIDPEKTELFKALNNCLDELLSIARLQDWHSESFRSVVDNAHKLIENYKKGE